MAEELPQNSSGSQVASKDSGVIAGVQSSDSTGKSATVQSNQNSQAPTTQNNQNNKKYDLGVLFVHGIGFQERGDVFNEIYPAIVNEISSDESVVFEEILASSEKENQARIIRDGKESSILFRESYWHGSEEDLNQTSGGGSSRLINTLLCLSWCVRILCLKFSQIRFGTPIFFASIVMSISLLLNDNSGLLRNLFQATTDRMMPRLAVAVTIFLIVVLGIFLVCFIDVVSIEEEDEKFNENMSLYELFFLDRLTKKHLVSFLVYVALSAIYVLSGQILPIVILLLAVLLVALYHARKKFGVKIVGLWNQINACADYIRSDQDLIYIDRVQCDLDRILNESNRVIVVSHSMGEYLSYKVLSQEKYRNLSNIYLISVGGGLGAVSLIGNSRVSDSEGNYSPINTLLVSSCVAFASMLNIFLFLYSWSHLFVDLWSIYKNFQGNLFSGLISSLIDVLGIVISFFIGRDIIRFGGVIENISKFKFYRYTHFFDPVGNFSNFVYGLNIIKHVTPILSFGHGVSTYFFGASRQGQPGKVDDFKFINMKYMQCQLVRHINSSLWAGSDCGYPVEDSSREKYRYAQNAIYLSVGFITIVFLEFLGIVSGVLLYNIINKTNYVINDPFIYVLAFGVFEYWGFKMVYVFIDTICSIYRSGDYRFKKYSLLIICPIVSFLIGVFCVGVWYGGIGIIKHVSLVKAFL